MVSNDMKSNSIGSSFTVNRARGVITHRQNRVTGQTIGLYDAQEAGMDVSKGPWATVCEEHGIFKYHTTKSRAVEAMSSVQAWCSVCSAPWPAFDVYGRILRDGDSVLLRYAGMPFTGVLDRAADGAVSSPTLDPINFSHWVRKRNTAEDHFEGWEGIAVLPLPERSPVQLPFSAYGALRALKKSWNEGKTLKGPFPPEVDWWLRAIEQKFRTQRYEATQLADIDARWLEFVFPSSRVWI